MKVGIIGCGVIGLTSGIRLLEEGHDVQILAKQTSPHLVSDVAAAFWMPYRAQPRERVLRWARRSFEVFQNLENHAVRGIFRVPITHLVRTGKPDVWWSELVSDCRELTSDEIKQPFVAGCTYTTFLVESPEYMPYLRARFESLGGKISVEVVRQILDLAPRFQSIVNCSGVEAVHICSDTEVYPIRGQVVRVHRPASMASSVLEAEGVFIVCRSTDCIIGGANADNDWSTDVRAEDRKALLERATVLCPALKESVVLEDRVGLRPGRSSVRVERDSSSKDCIIIHNYGHGGAGFALSWGCADDVVEMIRSS